MSEGDATDNKRLKFSAGLFASGLASAAVYEIGMYASGFTGQGLWFIDHGRLLIYAGVGLLALGMASFLFFRFLSGPGEPPTASRLPRFLGWLYLLVMLGFVVYLPFRAEPFTTGFKQLVLW